MVIRDSKGKILDMIMQSRGILFLNRVETLS